MKMLKEKQLIKSQVRQYYYSVSMYLFLCLFFDVPVLHMLQYI